MWADTWATLSCFLLNTVCTQKQQLCFRDGVAGLWRSADLVSRKVQSSFPGRMSLLFKLGGGREGPGYNDFRKKMLLMIFSLTLSSMTTGLQKLMSACFPLA